MSLDLIQTCAARPKDIIPVCPVFGFTDSIIEQQKVEITQWLVHTNPTDIHNRSRKLYEKQTGEWMLRSYEWKAYVEGDIRSLWIHGIPRAGKTILMSHLAELLESQARTDAVGCNYYYCYFGRNQDETESFLRWVISQLCNQLDAKYIPPKLQDLHERQQYPSYDTSLDILAQIL